MTADGANRAQARFVTAVVIGSTALLGSISFVHVLTET